MMYQLVKSFYASDSPSYVKRLSDNVYIPFDPSNTDYQAFLQWLAEGNEPLPPDAPATE